MPRAASPTPADAKSAATAAPVTTPKAPPKQPTIVIRGGIGIFYNRVPEDYTLTAERFNGTIIPFAWFAKGMRILDIADPFAPREVAYYEADAPQGFNLASSNDVTIDDRGLCYLIDRQRGVDIIETSVL